MSVCVVERAGQVTATRWLMPSGRRRDRRSACFAGRRDVRRLICMWLLMMKHRRLHMCWMASCVQTSSQLGRRAGQTTIRVRRFSAPGRAKHCQSVGGHSPSHYKASTACAPISRRLAVMSTTTCRCTTNLLIRGMHWTSSRLCRRRWDFFKWTDSL